jgi:SAM-dependent methyltransferase
VTPAAAVLRRSPARRALRLLRPASIDLARRVSQEPVLRRAALEGPPRGRCLNAGAGMGLYSGFLESFAEISEIVNLDISPAGVSAARSDPRHTDCAGSLTELPFEAASFDCTLCTNVLPCIDEDALAARELARVLRPGGHALISVRTADAPPPRTDPIMHGDGYRIVHSYSLANLRAMLADAGLEVVWHGYSCFLPMRWAVAVWRFPLARRGGARSRVPRLVMLAFGYADRVLRIGRPWDLTVLARARV